MYCLYFVGNKQSHYCETHCFYTGMQMNLRQHSAPIALTFATFLGLIAAPTLDKLGGLAFGLALGAYLAVFAWLAHRYFSIAEPPAKQLAAPNFASAPSFSPEPSAAELSYQQLFELTQEGIWLVDENGNTTKTNSAMAAMLGYSVAEMLGKHLTHFMDEQGRAEFATMFERRKSGNSEQLEYDLIKKTGERIHTMIQTAPIYGDHGQFQGAIAGIIDITQRRQAEQQLAWQANYDSLTSLPNRRFASELLEKEIARAKRRQHCGAVLFIDLDLFKNINDSLGHPVGDQLLIQVGDRLQKHLRTPDIVARLGGDEFIVILPELHSEIAQAKISAQHVANKLQAAIGQEFQVNQHPLNMTCSIGIAIFPIEQETIHDIIRQADTAMYRSKRDGRNLVRFFTQELQQEAERVMELQLLLPKAIADNQFQLFFQPQLNHQNQLVGAEALLRWFHPEKGSILPFHFIRAAEESGLILALGNWVLDAACKNLRCWLDAGLPSGFERIAINISPRQFIADSFVDHLCKVLDDAAITPNLIELEITEGMLLNNIDSNIAKMQILRRKGFHISIDDFGTGYSCLSYLKTLPISKLKIDQSFTHDLSSDHNDRAIVQTIILMATTLELDVLAEGVETVEQLEFLKSHGCLKYQGFYFGKPIEAEAFTEKWMRTSAKPLHS
ncbi:Hypothetical protein HDN1F_20940 [gamma proteobacterium HdN1]|nr:Hypothetical protein HDN1F_20940 [gamma proteobacterium HdN1]